MKPNPVPPARYAIIGGSSTFSIAFPEDCDDAEVEVLETSMEFETPFGTSARFKLLSFTSADGQQSQALTTKMHGRRPGADRRRCSQAVFWVLQQAGVRKIVGEGGVGSVNRLLEPRDIVVPDDFIDFGPQVSHTLNHDHLIVMRQPLCPTIRQALLASSYVWAREQVTEGDEPPPRVFDRGIYAVTQGPRFESRAEVAVLASQKADIVGQSLSPEVYLAREIGACYAGAYIVVNYAEGVVAPWPHATLRNIFLEDAVGLGRLTLRALKALTLSDDCGCQAHRRPTLLRYDIYDK